MRRVLKAIDSTNEWVGVQLKYLAMFMVAVVCSEVVMRYVFNHPTSQLPVLQTWSGTALYSLAFGYVMLHKAHVRVDVIYARLSRRAQSIVDVVMWCIFFLPSVGYLLFGAYNWMIHAWVTGERSMITYWYPVMAPIRTIVFIGLLLFMLQGLATVFRDAYMAVRSKPYD